MDTSLRRLAPLLLVLIAAACKSDGPSGGAVPCDPTSLAATPVSLEVGSAQVITGGNAVDCVRLARGSAEREYIVIAANASATPDVRDAYVVRAGPTSAASVLAAAGVRAAIAAPSLAADDDLHARIQGAARRLAPVTTAAVRDGGTASESGIPAPRGQIIPGTPTVGTHVWVRIPRLTATNFCTTYDSVRAEIKHIGRKTVIIQDSLAPANGFTGDDFAAIAQEFDDLIFATDTAYFGAPADLRADAGRVVIHYTRKVNEATARGSRSLLAGFFWAGDLYPRTGGANTSCRQSNEDKIFYLLVPDPTGTINGNVRTVADVRQRTRGTVAHEFEHMLNAGIRFDARRAFEDVWLDEALAHFAEEMVGRTRRGYTDMQELTFTNILASSTDLPDYRAFFEQNLLRFEGWLTSPPGSSPTSAAADTSLAVRGAAWALLRFTADHHSGGSPRTLTRALVSATNTGVPNLAQRAGVAFEELATRWLVANYADNLGLAGIPATSQYLSWHMRDAMTRAAVADDYPLRLVPLPPGGVDSPTVVAGSGSYYALTVPAGDGASTLQLVGATGIAPARARLVVIRTR